MNCAAMSMVFSLSTPSARVKFLTDLIKCLSLFRGGEDLVLKHPPPDLADPNLGHAEESFVALPGLQVMQDWISQNGDFLGSVPVLDAVGPVAVLVLDDPGVNVLGSANKDLIVSILDHVDSATGGPGLNFDFYDVVIFILMARSFVGRIRPWADSQALAIVLAG